MSAQTPDQGSLSGELPAASFRRAFLRLAPPFLFVLAVHFTALSEVSQLSVVLLVAACLLNALVVGLGGAGRRAVAGWLVLAAAMGLVLVGVSGGPGVLTNFVLLPSILINGMLLWVFGRTLLPARVPLIERMGRLEVGEMSPELIRYTRALTTGWTLFFALSFLASVVLAVEANLAIWSWAINFGVPALALLFFLGEHAYRVPRFGDEAPISPVQTLRAALRPAAWTAGG